MTDFYAVLLTERQYRRVCEALDHHDSPQPTLPVFRSYRTITLAPTEWRVS